MDDDEDDELLVCPNCFDNPGLQRRLIELRPKHGKGRCTFHPRSKGIPVRRVTDLIDEVIRNNYGHGSYNSQTDYFEGDDLGTVVVDLTRAERDEVVEALTAQLLGKENAWDFLGDQAFYSGDASYQRISNEDPIHNEHNERWRGFCHAIVHQQRFFNGIAKDQLSEIFSGIHLQRSSSSGAPVYAIQPGDPQSVIYRARTTSDLLERQKISANPGQELGPPPDRKRKPGRMNPSGISAFYGAFDIDTCIAELRPAVGSIVAAAKFSITEELWVLDMTRFNAPLKEPDLFAKDHHQRVTQWQFMQSFMQEIARPISPNDEHLDYIPTQAVAEFLANHLEFHLGGKRQRIEAIIFRSAQHPGGKNIVLLGNAGHVEHTAEIQIDSSMPRRLIAFPHSHADRPRLRVIADSVSLHSIDGAAFTNQPYRDYLSSNDRDEF